MNKRVLFTRILLAAVGVGVVAVIAIAFSESAVSKAGAGHVFASTSEVPKADTALVLGTSPRFRGIKNPFYEARLDTAAELFRSGKVRGILVSGDNSRVDYDEPSHMKADLASRGVPAEFITCDFAGFHTLDSIKRARQVFGQDRVIVVSQRFHVERALFLAKSAGLSADGLVAKDPPREWHARARAREAFARVKAVADVLLNRQPKFLGPRETVNLAAAP